MTTSSIGATSSSLLQILQQLNGGSAPSADETKAARKKLPLGTNSSDTSPLDKLFSVIDSDSDGKVSTTELSSFLDKLKGSGDLLQVQEQNQPPSASDIMKSADSDGDGALSLDEFKADLATHTPSGSDALSDSEAKKRFSRLDTNKDGMVSQDELAAAFGSGTTASATSSAASAPDLLGLLMQAVSAYSSTSNATSATSNAGLFGSLVKAA